MKPDILLAERTLAAQALWVSEQRYQALLASTTDYVDTVTMDGGCSVATSYGPGCENVSTRTLPWNPDVASQADLFRQFKRGDTLAVTEVQDTGTCIQPPDRVEP